MLKKDSQVFNADLNSGFTEAKSRVIDMETESIESLEVIPKVLHDENHEYDEDHQFDVSVPIEQLWPLPITIEERMISIEVFSGWFENWWDDNNKPALYPMLCYLCLFFDYAFGFAQVTRHLVYNGMGHQMEDNPTIYHQLHLRKNVIQQLHAAKGSLRNKLHRGVFEPVGSFLKAGCSCKEVALHRYCMGLSKTGLWPMDWHSSRKSLSDMLKGLEKFSYESPNPSCLTCGNDYQSIVKTVRIKVRCDFQGLCLDCMNSSKPKTGDVDFDYWSHDEARKWDESCRIQHGQPSLVFLVYGTA